ncbi:RNA methyltransferase [Candidatus Undinarchaeota archaeon]
MDSFLLCILLLSSIGLSINMLSVVLIGPKYSGNIGSVARAMKNFGFSELILVGNEIEIDDEARKYAVHAQDVLDKAKRYCSFDDFRKDYDFLIGTSGIPTKVDEHFHRISITPKQLSEKASRMKGKVCVVFGPEDIGLTNQQLKKCNLLVHIPTSKKYNVMNLSHSVAVILYELSNFPLPKFRTATNREQEVLYSQIDFLLKVIKVHNKKSVKLMLERIFGRAILTGREVNTLIGFFKETRKKLNSPKL